MQEMALLPPDYFEGTIKLEDVPQWKAEKMGIPQKLLRTKAEQEKMTREVREAEIRVSQLLRRLVLTDMSAALEHPEGKRWFPPGYYLC